MLSLAVSLTRLWTAFYTNALPIELRSQRREEIESDLWEHLRYVDSQQETPVGTALQLLLRLVLGAPSDLVWRVETGAALRFGKDPNMKPTTWSHTRVFALLLAILIWPIPPRWIQGPVNAINTGLQVKQESTLSIALLGFGGQVCLMPVLLGFMTIFWPPIDFAGLAWGSAEILTGVAGLAGLYFARQNLAAGLALISGSAVALALLATWALPGIIVLGFGVAVFAVMRWFAPTPRTAMPG